MNKLELVQSLKDECDVSGPDLSTTVGLTGELKRLSNWVNQAWNEIQQDHADYEWMRRDMTFHTVAGQAVYGTSTDIALTDFAAWKNDSFRAYLTSIGTVNEMFLQQLSYDAFRDYYLYASRRTTQSRPVAIAIMPNKDLALGLVPNDIYTIVGEYYRTPVALTIDNDVPAMPIRFHMMIVYRAMRKYGLFESAPEIISRADSEYAALLNNLHADQAPEFSVMGSLI